MKPDSRVGIEIGVCLGTVGLASNAAGNDVAFGVGVSVPVTLAETAIIHEKNRRTAIIAPHPIPIFIFRVCVRYHCHKADRLLRGV